MFKINQDMEDSVFDPSHYIKAEQEKYWVSTLVEQFIKYKEKGLAPSYKKDFKRMLNIYFKTTDVREIRKIDIIRFKEYVEIKKKNINSKTEKNISPKTVKNIIDVFNPSFPQGYPMIAVELIRQIQKSCHNVIMMNNGSI